MFTNNKPLPYLLSRTQKVIFTHPTLVLLFQKYFKFDPQVGRQMLRGEIATLDHYHLLGDKTKGQG